MNDFNLSGKTTKTVSTKTTFITRIIDQIYEVLEKRKNKSIVIALLILAILALPLFANNYVKEVMINTFFYMVLCSGLNIVIGYAGLCDLGYAAFFAVGAYTTGILSNMGVSFWLCIPIAIILSILAGVIIGGPTLRLRSDYLAVVTLGFGEITKIVARNLQITGGASGLVGIKRPVIFGMVINTPNQFYYLFFVLVIVAVVVAYRLHHSRIGRAWKYIREDEDAAEAMGINTLKVKLLAYMTGGVYGGVAGCFFAAKMTSISPETFLFTQSAMILLAVVLGGMGKIPGVLLGAAFLVLFPEVFRGYGEFRMLIFGILLIIVMLFRPQGLWPDRRS